ncbi:proteasome subunit beta [Pseudomonas typographi]|uniref:Proteasome subunit beta n=1 Tax=Pseudomonas typographi TaxID=2715964 RepID=A0ABR7Z9N6_9PSED|nr:proteasome subunit beta [Pseudomonas typographi]MBD1602092.1 proteasome subunit beta [Pseudomonas typographi]
MTTIAYKDGVIAYDSRCTRGTTITDDDCEKLETVKGVHFLCTGCTCDFGALIGAYFGTASATPVEASGYAVDGGTLWLIGYDDKTGFWKNRISPDRADAIGNGSPFALTAMDMGATAAEAIEMAKRRDTCTGGQVRTLTIKAEEAPQG